MHHRGRRYHGARRLGTMKGIRTMNMSRKEFLRSGLSSMAVAGLPTTGVAAAAVAGASPAAESGPVTITTLNPTIRLDRKSVVEGKSVSVRVDLGGRRLIKKKDQSSMTVNTDKKQIQNITR